MPRQTTVLQVFLSSPTDLEEERSLAGEVIDELNRTLEPSGFALKLLRWETHSRPGIGVDAQDVLNRQLPQDYDIYLGIMWGRFGTPTTRAGSGTLEEFEAALSRYREGEGRPSIMFYFKSTPVSPLDIDTGQLAAVQAFRSRLRDEGVLYKTFDNLEDFQSQLRLHLGEEARAWQQRPASRPSAVVSSQRQSASEPTSPATLPVASDDLGLFDLIEVSNESFAGATGALTSIASALEELNKRTDERVTQLNGAAMGEPDQRVRQGRAIAKRLASDMSHFVARANIELPVLTEYLHEAIRSYGLAMALARDFGDAAGPPLRESLETVQSLRQAMVTFIGHTEGIRVTVSQLPRVQKDLNQAKRDTLGVFEALVRQTLSADDLLASIQRDIRMVLPSLGNGPPAS